MMAATSLLQASLSDVVSLGLQMVLKARWCVQIGSLTPLGKFLVHSDWLFEGSFLLIGSDWQSIKCAE